MILVAALIGLFVLTYGALAVIALRRPLLAHLAYREAIHRPWQTGAAGGIVVGLFVGLALGFFFVPEYLPSAQGSVQVGQLVIVVALIIVTAAAVTVLPALAVARTAPAAALRMAD